MSPSNASKAVPDKKVPDVVYLVNVSELKNAPGSTETPAGREIWHFVEADLFTLNTLSNKGSATKIPLPKGLPENWDWTGKMFGMFSEMLLDMYLALTRC